MGDASTRAFQLTLTVRGMHPKQTRYGEMVGRPLSNPFPREGVFSTRLHPTGKIEYSGLDAGDTCQIVQLQVFDRFDEISHDKTQKLRRFPVAIRPRIPAPEDVEVTPRTTYSTDYHGSTLKSSPKHVSNTSTSGLR